MLKAKQFCEGLCEAYLRVERGMSDFFIFWCIAYHSRLFEFLCMIITALISCRAGNLAFPKSCFGN